MKKKKIISLCMAAIMAVSTVPLTAYAASSVGSTSNDTTIGEDTAQGAKTQYSEIGISDTQTQVYLTVEDKDLIASLPTTIIVPGTPTTEGKYVGEYSVGVSGDMSGDKVVTIEPESANVALKQKGNNDKTASISQKQTVFNSDDFKNKTRTNGAVTADSLTAGSWNGKFNFNIRCQQVQYNYYSSIELAANDANNMTTANADVSKDDINKAVAALVISNNKATIKMLNDESNVNNVTLTQDTSINLNKHTVTFSEGKYLTFEKNLTINDGVINIDDSNYGILGTKDNTENSFVLNNVTFNQNVSENISFNSYCIDISTVNSNCSNLEIYQKGKGNSSYGVYGYTNRNEDEKAQGLLEHFIFESTVENPSKIRGTQNGKNDEIRKAKIKISSQNNSSVSAGIFGSNTSSSLKIFDSDIDAYSVNGYADGIYTHSPNTTIKNCNVNGDNGAKQTDGNGSIGVGIRFKNKPTTSSKTIVEDCTIYGKQWGLETPDYGDAVIKNCNVTATNHTAYICGNADIYNSTFKVANRDKYPNGTLDAAYGFYAGSNIERVKTHIVNIYNCEIGNPVDTSGVNVSNFGVTAKNNGYCPPKEINIYDSIIYEGKTSVFSFNASSAYMKNYAKFNLYGSTKLMANSTTELSLEQVSNDIDWFTNILPDSINYGLKADWESSKDEYIYFGGNVSPNKLIDFHMYCTDKAPKSQAYEDWANVYDYR